jgi:SAM-dependent methyltransferase
MLRFLPFRKTTIGKEPLAVAMSGVRTGERVLQIDLDDPAVAAGIAAKTGISGEAVLVVPDNDAAVRANRAAKRIDEVLNVRVVPFTDLPFDADAFDAVIIHNVGGRFSGAPRDTRDRIMREISRVLRAGGRLVVLDAGEVSGLPALMSRAARPDPQYAAAGGSVSLLEAAGFRPVRLLADRDGYRFTEGLRP